MSLDSQKRGYNIQLRCDRCGHPCHSLHRVKGTWVNPQTGRKLFEGTAWLCKACYERVLRVQ